MQKFFVFYFFVDVFLFMDLLNPRFKSWAKEGLYFCVYLCDLRAIIFPRMPLILADILYFS